MLKRNIFILILIMITLSISGSEKKALREKRFILKLYSQGYYVEVLDGIENFEKLYKKHMSADLYLVKAESLYNTGKYKESVPAYEKCADLSDKYKDYCKYSSAYAWMEHGNFIKALNLFKELADRDSGDYRIKAILNTARIYNKMLQPQESIKYYEKYMDENEELVRPALIIEYSDVLYSGHNIEKSKDVILDSLDKIEDTGEIILLREQLADIQRKNGDTEQALESYGVLYELTGDDKYNYYSGIIFFNDSDYKKAVAAFEKVESGDFSETSDFYIGQSYYLMLQFRKALEYFNRLHKAERDKIREKSVYFSAACHFQLKEYKDAMKVVEKVEEKDIDILELSRDIYISMNQYQKAINIIRELLQKDVNIAYNYFIAGQCYFNLGNFKRAYANFELAMQKSDTEQIKNNSLFEMAGILIIQDKPDKAVEIYQKIPASSSLYNESRLKVVDILRKQGKFEKVFELLSRIEEKGSESDF
ncbi:MAG: tetratricopeptide repeat protein, partial [Candidatus Muiribacteriaceae bacterium]